MRQTAIISNPASADYELIDSGEGEKLERFGKFILSRPDPQALWHKNLPVAEWKKADGRFEGGSWVLKKGVPVRWSISLAGLSFHIKPTPFKHTGIFPEQAENWRWMRELIQGSGRAGDLEVLNLFAYTGGATLAVAAAGAKAVHVDGSKSALSWARENAELSGLADRPIRWILEDARTFVRREAKRGRSYQGIVMDAPAFGHGPKGQVWKIEEHFLPLMDECSKLLGDRPLFFLINGYAAGYSALAYENNLRPFLKKHGGTLEIGELSLEERPAEGGSRLLPCGIFARWKAAP